MPDLAPLTALGATAPRSATFGALTLTETPDIALASLALRRGTAQPTPFGLALPGPGHWVQGGDHAALWTAPGQWLIEAPGRAESDFAAKLAQIAPGCSVTDQTDGWVCIEITSTAGATPIVRLMEKLVNIDTARFTPGSATRTGLEHQGVILIRRAEERLAVWGMRSLAGSLWHALETAAQRREEGEWEHN